MISAHRLGAVPLPLRQAWRRNKQAGFAPGKVCLWGNSRRLAFSARLNDPRPWTRATHTRQLLCLYGDVLELFFGWVGCDEYYEFHFAPNGLVMALRWPNRSSYRGVSKDEDLAPFLVPPDPVSARVFSWSEGWGVEGVIHLESLSPENRSRSPRQLEIQFARYDYLTDGLKVISSTAPLRRPCFHRRQDWHRFMLKKAGTTKGVRFPPAARFFGKKR